MYLNVQFQTGKRQQGQMRLKLVINIIFTQKVVPSPITQITNGMQFKKKKKEEKANEIFMLPAVILGVFPRMVHLDLWPILIQMT